MSAETYVEKLASAFTHSTKVIIPSPDNDEDIFEILRNDESIQGYLKYYEDLIKTLCLGSDLSIETIISPHQEAIKLLKEQEKEIEKRKQAVISAYAIRYRDFCELNANTRRMGASVQVQFRELVEWTKK